MSKLLGRLRRTLDSVRAPEPNEGAEFATFPTEVGEKWESHVIDKTDIPTASTFPTPKQEGRPQWASARLGNESR